MNNCSPICANIMGFWDGPPCSVLVRLITAFCWCMHSSVISNAISILAATFQDWLTIWMMWIFSTSYNILYLTITGNHGHVTKHCFPHSIVMHCVILILYMYIAFALHSYLLSGVFFSSCIGSDCQLWLVWHICTAKPIRIGKEYSYKKPSGLNDCHNGMYTRQWILL